MLVPIVIPSSRHRIVEQPAHSALAPRSDARTHRHPVIASSDRGITRANPTAAACSDAPTRRHLVIASSQDGTIRRSGSPSACSDAPTRRHLVIVSSQYGTIRRSGSPPACSDAPTRRHLVIASSQYGTIRRSGSPPARSDAPTHRHPVIASSDHGTTHVTPTAAALRCSDPSLSRHRIMEQPAHPAPAPRAPLILPIVRVIESEASAVAPGGFQTNISPARNARCAAANPVPPLRMCRLGARPAAYPANRSSFACSVPSVVGVGGSLFPVRSSAFA